MSEDNTQYDTEEVDQSTNDGKPKVIKNLKEGTAKIGAALGNFGSQIATATKNVNEKYHVSEHAKEAGSKVGNWMSVAAQKTVEATINVTEKTKTMVANRKKKNDDGTDDQSPDDSAAI